MFGMLERGIKMGRGGQGKEWTACVNSDARAFNIPGNWREAARDAQSWAEVVTEGRRRFMAQWRKEEEGKAKSHQEKRTAV